MKLQAGPGARRPDGVGLRTDVALEIGEIEAVLDNLHPQLVAHDLRPQQFCAELTETAIMSDAHRHRSLLDELHEAGVQIAIDDFGAGHSSLARLRDLPVQVMKVQAK